MSSSPPTTESVGEPRIEKALSLVRVQLVVFLKTRPMQTNFYSYFRAKNNLH